MKRKVPKKAYEAERLYTETQNVWTVASRMNADVKLVRRWIRQVKNRRAEGPDVDAVNADRRMR